MSNRENENDGIIGRPRTLHDRLNHVEEQLDKLTIRVSVLLGALGAITIAIAVANFLTR